MSGVTASEAPASLYRLIDEVTPSHHLLLTAGKRGNAVLVSEMSWNAIQEIDRRINHPKLAWAK